MSTRLGSEEEPEEAETRGRDGRAEGADELLEMGNRVAGDSWRSTYVQ